MLRKIAVALVLFLLPNFINAQPQQLPQGTIVHRDIPYVTDGHERQQLDLYLPPEKENLPLIIWIHGGAWWAGSKDHFNDFEFITTGFAVASINYRLSQHAIFPAQIEDCKAAVRWLRANAEKYGLDPYRFGAFGRSAGGHLSALLGTTREIKKLDVGENLDYSSEIQAVADFYGPTDFLQMDAHRQPTAMEHNPPESPESKLVGGPIQENKDKVQFANPITYVSQDDPPFLIIHGDNDQLVPHHQSELLHTALLEKDLPVTFYTVKKGGHGGFKDPRVRELVESFFLKYLANQDSQ